MIIKKTLLVMAACMLAAGSAGAMAQNYTTAGDKSAAPIFMNSATNTSTATGQGSSVSVLPLSVKYHPPEDKGEPFADIMDRLNSNMVESSNTAAIAREQEMLKKMDARRASLQQRNAAANYHPTTDAQDAEDTVMRYDPVSANKKGGPSRLFNVQ